MAAQAVLIVTPSRAKEIEAISFRRPIEASADLDRFFGIDMMAGIGTRHRDFLRLRFLRWQLYERGLIVADQDYVEQAGDRWLRIGRLMRESRRDARNIIRFCRLMARNLHDGFGSMRIFEP